MKKDVPTPDAPAPTDSGAAQAQPQPSAGKTGSEAPPASPSAAPLDEKAALHAKLVEYENDLKRLQAEFQNYQNRVAKEKTQAHLDGQASVLRHFISFQDEMDSALSHLKAGANAKGAPGGDASAASASANELTKGVSLLHRKLISMFSSLGVKEIRSTGPADPHLHEVLMQVPGGHEGNIAQVLRKGYVMGEHVLRVAQVSVYSGQKPDEKKSEEIKTEN